jgi:hypothetical protein
MKVKDTKTGLTLESTNDFVIKQWLKYPEKYEPVAEKPAKPEK